MKEETTKQEKLLCPKASVIIRTRLRAPSARLFNSHNINAEQTTGRMQHIYNHF